MRSMADGWIEDTGVHRINQAGYAEQRTLFQPTYQNWRVNMWLIIKYYQLYGVF